MTDIPRSDPGTDSSMTGRKLPVPRYHRLDFVRTATTTAAQCCCGWRSQFFIRPQFATAAWEQHCIEARQ